MKEVLHDKLRESRAALLSRLDGLGDYDLRRPLTPSGTNLLGLVKHLAGPARTPTESSTTSSSTRPRGSRTGPRTGATPR